MAAAYGGGILGGARLDFATWFSLWLNRGRAFHQQSAMIALGVGMATGQVKPDASWFEAFAESSEEAKDQHSWYQADQLEQEVIARYTKGR